VAEGDIELVGEWLGVTEMLSDMAALELPRHAATLAIMPIVGGVSADAP